MTIFFNPIIWWNIIFDHFFKKKKTIKNVVRGIIMLEVQSFKKLPKKLLIFIADIL